MIDCCGKLVHGAVGLAKAALGIGAADGAEIARRRGLCCQCPDVALLSESRGLTVLSQCRACGCLIVAKTKLAGEQCPVGQWGPCTRD